MFVNRLIQLCFLISILAYARPLAAELPRSCYSNDELVRVRSWEKAWAGQRIDRSNIDEVAAWLPESYLGAYKNPSKWGAPPEGLHFFIAPYRPVSETTGMSEATRRYASGISLQKDGSLVPYAQSAGRPFPVPNSGIEIAWNFEYNTHGDASFYKRTGYNINPSRKVDKIGDQDAWELFWIHRVDVDPRPALPDNPKGIARSTFYHMYSPPEFKNTRMFNLRYIDHHKSDDAYMWFSAFRRIQRISTRQRTDAIDGTDLIYDDEYGWDGQILRNTYHWKGSRELLCARHQDISAAERRPGQAIMNGITRERVKTYTVEVISKDPNYLYSKRVWQIDPETYLVLWTEIYDEQGRFWKCFEYLTCDVPLRSKQTKNFIVGSHYIDFQRNHAGIWRNTRIDVGADVRPDLFTLHNLQKGGY